MEPTTTYTTPTPFSTRPLWSTDAMLYQQPFGQHASKEICFSFDTTGSMYLSVLQMRQKTGHVREIIQKMLMSVPQLKIALFAHGDYCDKNYVTKYLDFTDDANVLSDFLENLEGTNGGDWEECYELVLHEVRTKLSWTHWSQKSLVMIGDAIPHEVPPSGKFGDFIVYDWRQEVQMLAMMGVKVHGIECCMPMYQSLVADEFWKSLTQLGNGKLVHLQHHLSIKDAIVAFCFGEYSWDMFKAFELEVYIRDGLGVRPELMKMFDTLRGYVITMTNQVAMYYNRQLYFNNMSTAFNNESSFTPPVDRPTNRGMVTYYNSCNTPYGMTHVVQKAVTESSSINVKPHTLEKEQDSFSNSGDSGIEVDIRSDTTTGDNPCNSEHIDPGVENSGNKRKRSVEDVDSDTEECISRKRRRGLVENRKRSIDNDTDSIGDEQNPKKRLRYESVNISTNTKQRLDRKGINSTHKKPVNREQVTEKSFEFRDLAWTSWCPAFSSEQLNDTWVERVGRKFGSGAGIQKGYRNDALFDDGDDNVGVYEVGVQVKDHGKRFPMYACHSITGFPSNQWETRLLSQRRLTKQIDDVLKEGCRVYIRKAKPTRLTRAARENIPEICKKINKSYDYAWSIRRSGKSRHRQVKRCGVTLSNNRY